MPGHTSSKLMRHEFYNYKKMYVNQFPDLKYPGDQIEAFLIADFFKIYCIPKIMSSYRYVTDSGTSYSATYKFDNSAKINRIKFYYYCYIFQKKMLEKRNNRVKPVTIYILYVQIQKRVKNSKAVN